MYAHKKTRFTEPWQERGVKNSYMRRSISLPSYPFINWKIISHYNRTVKQVPPPFSFCSERGGGNALVIMLLAIAPSKLNSFEWKKGVFILVHEICRGISSLSILQVCLVQPERWCRMIFYTPNCLFLLVGFINLPTP